MVYRLLPMFIAPALLLTLAGCTNTYLGRFVMLQGPDVEDYRQMPTRTIAASSRAANWVLALDPLWMDRMQLSFGGRDLRTAQAFDTFVAANHTTAFLAVVDGKVVYERYYNGYTPDSLCKAFSMSKSVLSALFGIAQADGTLASTDRLGDHVQGIENPQLAAVTLQQLLDNVAGFDYERGFLPWKQQPRMYYTTDVRSYVLDAQFAFAPGKKFVGEDLSPLLLGLALERALQKKGTAQSLSDFAAQRLWQPLGAQHDALWTLDREGDGMEKTESGFVARAQDLARFGQLYLDGGMAGGKQVVPAAWVSTSTTAPTKGNPNLFTDGFHVNLWWGTNRAGRVRSDFFANGHFGQRIYVSPDKSLVLVRLGSNAGDVDWTKFLADIADRWPATRATIRLPGIM